MSRFDFQKAIYKYAILLSITSIINLVWIYYFHNYLAGLMMESQNSIYKYMSLIPRVVDILFNIVFAILVYRDFKINGIKSPLIVIITLLFGFIGIALFFIQLIYNVYLKKNSTQHTI